MPLNPLLKLLFHHDQPLAGTAESTDLLSLFAAPHQTWSQLWISGSLRVEGGLSLSTSTLAAPVLRALETVLPADLCASVLQQENGFFLHTKTGTFRPAPAEASVEKVLGYAQKNETLVRRIPGIDGFDLETAGFENIHAKVFNSLVPLVAAGTDMWSINGKRVSSRDQLYLERTGSARLPHGFEIVAPHFRL